MRRAVFIGIMALDASILMAVAYTALSDPIAIPTFKVTSDVSSIFGNMMERSVPDLPPDAVLRVKVFLGGHAPQVTTSTPLQTPSPPVTSPPVLVGIISGSEGSLAIIAFEGRLNRLREGATIANRTVLKIAPRAVELMENGKVDTLTLHK